VTVCCEHGVELSGSKKGKFIDQQSDYKLLKNDSAPWGFWYKSGIIYRRRGGNSLCILDLSVDGCEWESSRLNRFIPKERTLRTRRILGLWVPEPVLSVLV
jgi:hypothetical protein